MYCKEVSKMCSLYVCPGFEKWLHVWPKLIFHFSRFPLFFLGKYITKPQIIIFTVWNGGGGGFNFNRWARDWETMADKSIKTMQVYISPANQIVLVIFSCSYSPNISIFS